MRNLELGDDGEFSNVLPHIDKRKYRESSGWEKLPGVLRFSIVVIPLLVLTVILTSITLLTLVSKGAIDLKQYMPANSTPKEALIAGQSITSGLAVVVRGADGLLYYKLSNDGYWSDWRSFQPPPVGATTDTPTLIAGEKGHMELFVRGTDDAVWHSSFNGTNWSTWDSLGGVLTSGPGAVFSR